MNHIAINKIWEGIIINVLSMVIGAIVLGAGMIVWNENISNKERIGKTIGHLVAVQQKVDQNEKSLTAICTHLAIDCKQ